MFKKARLIYNKYMPNRNTSSNLENQSNITIATLIMTTSAYGHNGERNSFEINDLYQIVPFLTE